MNVDSIVNILAAFSPLIAIASSAIMVYIAMRKYPAEKRDIDGSAAETFEGIASRSAARISTLEEEKETEKKEKKELAEKVECLVGKVDDLSHRLDVSEQMHIQLKEENMVLRESLKAAESRIAVMEVENAEMKDYISRLVHQVQSLGGTPVELRPQTPRKTRKN